MDRELWKQVDALLDAALELPPEEREQFVVEVCDGSDDLREEVTIWLERSDIPLARSELLVVDEDLDPSEPLLETADKP